MITYILSRVAEIAEKRDLYFVCRDRGIDRLIAKNVTEDEAFKAMKQFMAERNYKHYYTRSWTDAMGCKHYDVGSHTEFFEWRTSHD